MKGIAGVNGIETSIWTFYVYTSADGGTLDEPVGLEIWLTICTFYLRLNQYSLDA